MLTESPQSPVIRDWYLFAMRGDLMLKLATDLTIGEDASGELVLNPDPDHALLRLSVDESVLNLQVLALDQMLSVTGIAPVQHLRIDQSELREAAAVRIHLTSSKLTLGFDIASGGRERQVLDVTLTQTPQPAIVRERIELTSEPEPHLRSDREPEPVAAELIEPIPEAVTETRAAPIPPTPPTPPVAILSVPPRPASRVKKYLGTLLGLLVILLPGNLSG